MLCNFFSLLPAGSIFFFFKKKALCVCVLITLTVKGSDGIYNDYNYSLQKWLRGSKSHNSK